MVSLLLILSTVLLVLSILPFVPGSHWIFRIGDFVKLQLTALQLIVFVVSWFYVDSSVTLFVLQMIQGVAILYHLYLLIRFTKFWRTSHARPSNNSSSIVKLISANIYQYNRSYDRFIAYIEQEEPDLFLTMESDQGWEHAMRGLEEKFPNFEKVTLDNTYGMHFYTKLKVLRSSVHYFVADDLPSIEVELETRDGFRFVFFGVHPPPPSPTEEETSKERDGDLLSVAKKIRDYQLPVVVSGDFNNVAWARSSILFKRTSQLIDARIGRGVLATFHARYRLLRFPLDLFFHSPSIIVDQLNIGPNIGSDHFPIVCSFCIDAINHQEKLVDDLQEGEMEEVNEVITEGKQEESEGRE